MRFYKLNGVWQSWDYLHNELGYAEHETRPTVFKSCADATWGENAGNGYYDGDVNDMINGTFWTDADPTGWFDLDGLVWNSETYPADAAPSLLVKDGVASDALVITCDDGNYYLIRAIIDTTAWIPESEVEALGWRSPSFVVVDSTTGKVVSGCNQELTTYELPSVVLNSEDGYETYELPAISLAVPKTVIGVPITGPVQAFWFTDNGRDETSDKMFTVVGNPLFNEDGSVARNELYDSAIPLSFMQHDGNMFEADSDSDIVRYLPVTDRLVLSIPGDSTTRGKSAWSVQVAKLFVLSYANTQLPDVQIELPINEVGTYGTSITLPTIDGEYESGGKTWKPTAWDIGAFGSSYSLTADTVAHLVFEEVQQYQEITLYIQSGSKNVQTRITSGFTGDVNSSYVYPLYRDENLTIPWSGYDYSNDYQVGYIETLDGEWHRRIDNIGDMPDTTVSTGVTLAFVLLDNNAIWLCCNSSSALSTSPVSGVIVLRIYPKEQQYHAAYVYGSAMYENAYIGISNNKTCTKGPGSLQYIQTPHQFPHITLQKVLGAAGNEITATTFETGQGEDGTRFHVHNSGMNEAYIRTVIYTLEYPVIGYWLKSDGTNISTSSGVAYPLMNLGGEIIEIDNNFDYFPIALIQHNGNFATTTYSYLNNATMGAFDTSNPTRLCFKQVSGTLSLSYVQYYKKPKPIETTFGADVTIPAGYEVESVTCSRGYAFATNVVLSGTVVDYELPGEKVYFDDTDISLIGVKVRPALKITVINTLSQTIVATLSSKSGDTGAGPETASASYVNSGGFLVKGTAKYSDSLKSSNVANAMQRFPVYFNLADSAGNWLYFCFNVPQTLWQFSGGVFSWLGDTTNMFSLAYWYNTRAVQINLRQI